MRRIKTLYASADSDSIDAFIQNLSSYGYDVVPCTRGATAVRMAEEHRFDIAIISMDVIGLNGFEICRSLRERFDDSDLPIVLRAARDSDRWRLTAFESGANCFAFEPIVFDRLDRVMRNLLRFKFHHEGQMPVADALRLMDAVYVDPGGRVDAVHTWPSEGDYREFDRYALMLVANHVDASEDKKDELLACFALLLHMAGRMGRVADAVRHLEKLTAGTQAEHIAREIRMRYELNRPLAADESACPGCVEAIIVLIGFAMYRTCMDLDVDEAFTEMHASTFTYDESLLEALESVVRKDRFLDSIFTTEVPAAE